MLILLLPLLGLSSMSVSLSPWLCLPRPRECDMICWKVDLISRFFTFFLLVVWVDGMWLGSWRKQGMLTQGPAPDRKCKLNISSTLTLPPLLDCLICARNSMSILLLLQMLGDGMVIFYQGMGGGLRGGYYLTGFGVFCLSFCVLFSHILCSFFGLTRKLEFLCVFLFFLCFLCLWSV